MTFFCIGDPDTVAGFRLAGVRGTTVSDPDQTWDVFMHTVSQSDCGLIIITEKLADMIRPRMEALRIERKRPLVVEIPGPEGPLPGMKGVGEFVQEAVGMRISQEVIHGNRP